MTESVTLPQYTLGSGGVEQERLRRQADDLRPRSEIWSAACGRGSWPPGCSPGASWTIWTGPPARTSRRRAR